MKVESSEESSDGGRRNIFALGFVSFFTDISSEMVFSLLPAFIIGLPGSSAAVLGIIEGVAEALGARAPSVHPNSHFPFATQRFNAFNASNIPLYALYVSEISLSPTIEIT